MSGYKSALEAAGAVVHAYERFGDWQGSWFAYVTYNGETGFVGGSFGSCSECDAFEHEFNYDDEDADDYQERLADFGREYLDGRLCSGTEIISLHRLDRDSEWDSESGDAIDWIRSTENGGYSGKLH